jgi:subtilisin-like proprotein convertase family protein
MSPTFRQRLARLANSFRRPPARPAARPRFRPTLEGLEDRALLSTLGVLNLDNGPGLTNVPVSGAASSGGMTPARSASLAAPGGMVFRATDVPQPVDYLDVFTTSFINVPQSVAIASLKVQLNVTYPLDNDLTIDLIAPDGTDVPLSYFEGTGANFQNTIVDDRAATPIGAGNSPFAGSYRPEAPLSAVAGMNAQGTWELQIIDYGASSGTLNSWSLIVQPVGSPAPAASSFTVSGFPSSTTAGQAGRFTVTARDANGNVATGYTGTVHSASSAPQAGLPADYTFTAADAGSHTFSAALKTAGTQSLTVTDTAASGLTGTEAGIAVSPAAASRLKVSAPAGATAGTAFSVTITALDAYGNTATGYAGTVHFASSDGRAVLPADSALTNGADTFSVTLKTAGSQTLTDTDTAGGTLTGSAAVSVSPAVSGALVFHATDPPQTITPGNIVYSVINVPQSLTVASVKVQVNITYPLDSNLRIDLVYYDNSGLRRSILTLSDFVGTGANFQDTTFDDAAATPIAAGTPPFAGSYRPSDPLSALAGHNAQGYWVLEVGSFAGRTGAVNSWSLIIQPAASPTTLLAAAGPNVTAGSPRHTTAASSPLSLAPIDTPARLGLPAAGVAVDFGSPGLVVAGQANALAAGAASVSAVPRQATSDGAPGGQELTSLAGATAAADGIEPADAGNAPPLLHPRGHRRLANG